MLTGDVTDGFAVQKCFENLDAKQFGRSSRPLPLSVVTAVLAVLFLTWHRVVHERHERGKCACSRWRDLSEQRNLFILVSHKNFHRKYFLLQRKSQLIYFAHRGELSYCFSGNSNDLD